MYAIDQVDKASEADLLSTSVKSANRAKTNAANRLTYIIALPGQIAVEERREKRLLLKGLINNQFFLSCMQTHANQFFFIFYKQPELLVCVRRDADGDDAYTRARSHARFRAPMLLPLLVAEVH